MRFYFREDYLRADHYGFGSGDGLQERDAFPGLCEGREEGLEFQLLG